MRLVDFSELARLFYPRQIAVYYNFNLFIYTLVDIAQHNLVIVTHLSHLSHHLLGELLTLTTPLLSNPALLEGEKCILLPPSSLS